MRPPVLRELLMTYDPAETPDRGLVNGTQPGSRHRLGIGGNQKQSRSAGVVLGEGLDEPQHGEDTEPVALVDRGVLGDVERPAVDDPPDGAVTAAAADQLVHLLGNCGLTT